MNSNAYLNEERYKTKNKLSIIALIVLVIGLSIGGFLIYTGITRGSKSKIDELKIKLAEEKNNLLLSKSSIEENIKPINYEIKKLEREPFKGFDKAYYERQDKINELKSSIADDNSLLAVINSVLDERNNNCHFEETNINTYTSKYCAVKNKLYDISETDNSFTYYMFGGFIIFTTIIISNFIFITSRGREITAFYAQQSMPIVKEGIDEITPSVSKASEEIAKSIKKGLNDADRNR